MHILLTRTMHVRVKHVIYIVSKDVCIATFKISVFFYLIIYLWVFSLPSDLEGGVDEGCNPHLK